MLKISNIGAVLKKIIVPVIQDQLPKENIFFDKVKRNSSVTVANNQIFIAARTGKHSGIYTVAEGIEPRSGRSKYQQPFTDMKYAFGTLELTDQALVATEKGDMKAIASILATEIKALKDDFKLDLNRQFHGAGTGRLCLANAAGEASVTLIVKDNPAGLDATEYLAEGMFITIAATAAVEIVSVDSAVQVTLAAARTWSIDDIVRKADAAECMGLAGIIDDGDNVATIQNILRSANPWANAFAEDTVEALTEAQMISLYLKTKRLGGSKVIFAGEALYSKFGQLLTSMKKTADLKEILSGGWKGLEFMDGVGVYLDFDTWSGYMQFVDFDALTIAEMSDAFQWLEADAHGGILKRSSTNRTVWEGTIKYYLQLIGLKFRSMGRLSGKT